MGTNWKVKDGALIAGSCSIKLKFRKSWELCVVIRVILVRCCISEPRGTGGQIRKEAGAAGQRKGYPGSFRR